MEVQVHQTSKVTQQVHDCEHHELGLHLFSSPTFLYDVGPALVSMGKTASGESGIVSASPLDSKQTSSCDAAAASQTSSPVVLDLTDDAPLQVQADVGAARPKRQAAQTATWLMDHALKPGTGGSYHFRQEAAPLSGAKVRIMLSWCGYLIQSEVMKFSADN